MPHPPAAHRSQRSLDLEALLRQGSPPDDHGRRSLPSLARALGITRQRLQQIIVDGEMPPGRADRIVEVSGGLITADAIAPFIRAD